MNVVKPNMIPHINANELWNAFLFYHFILIIMFDFAVVWKGQWSVNGYVSVTFDLFLDENPTSKSLHLVIIWTFSDSKSRKWSEKSHIPNCSAFWPLLLIKTLCSDQWSDFQIIDIRKNPIKFCFYSNQ